MCKKGGPRCASHEAQRAATSLIPRRGQNRKYYAGADARHLPASRSHATGTGSQFLDEKLKRLNDVAALAWRQRPDHLDGDDRDELIRLGAPRDAFNDGIRYLLVRTPGTLGITRSDSLPDATPIKVVRTKPDTPLALAVEADEAPRVDYGTIIIGGDAVTGNEIIYTAHPGHPIPATPNSTEPDPFADLEGHTITLGDARLILGRETWLQTTPKTQ